MHYRFYLEQANRQTGQQIFIALRLNIDDVAVAKVRNRRLELPMKNTTV